MPSLERILPYISMNYKGVKDDIMKLLSSEKVYMSTEIFLNDISTIAIKDDVLTVLIHLGYLGYDDERKEAFVPNLEAKIALEKLL